ncbi:MAG TPA: hypothetical protein VFZ69_09950 [Longimicrobiales bacterium]
MNTVTCRVVAAGISLLVLGACADSPLQPEPPLPRAFEPAIAMASSSTGVPAERWVENYVYDYSDVYFRIECDDELSELIAMEGELHVSTRIIFDAAGMAHYTSQVRSSGLRGVGVETGEEFRGAERVNEMAHPSEGGNSGTYRYETRLTGTESGREFRIVTLGVWAYDADGNMIRDRERVFAECSF